MSYLDHIEGLNRYRPAEFVPFHIDGALVGQVRPAFARELARWHAVFQFDEQGLSLVAPLRGFEARSRAVAGVIDRLRADGVINRHHGEPYRVAADFASPPLLMIDRASVAWFGIRAYGQHLNAYVLDGGGMKMWLGRRSRSKPSFPGMLDQLVAGGLPYGIPLAVNLAKECWEEAAIPAELAARARPVGTVSYCCETGNGLKPDVLFNYDLELPAGFVPHANDGEMEEFLLLPLAEVAEIVDTGEAFKPNCNLVVIDFLIRHGVLPPDHPDYVALTEGLHRGGPFAE